MGIYIKKEELEALRERYPKGCRVELVKMDDPYREMPPGLKGVVTGIDDSGSIHVDWQNGSSSKGCPRHFPLVCFRQLMKSTVRFAFSSSITIPRLP